MVIRYFPFERVTEKFELTKNELRNLSVNSVLLFSLQSFFHKLVLRAEYGSQSVMKYNDSFNLFPFFTISLHTDKLFIEWINELNIKYGKCERVKAFHLWTKTLKINYKSIPIPPYSYIIHITINIMDTASAQWRLNYLQLRFCRMVWFIFDHVGLGSRILQPDHIQTHRPVDYELSWAWMHLLNILAFIWSFTQTYTEIGSRKPEIANDNI